MSKPEEELTQPIIFEAWGPVGDRPYSISTKDNCQSLKEKGIMEKSFVPLLSIRASSWEEAMTVYFEIQGWGPYLS